MAEPTNDAVSDERLREPTRDDLGAAVREVWICWAHVQPNPKPSWLVRYDDLPEPDKEVDRQIGETLYGSGKDNGADFVLDALAKALGVTQWTNHDGSETWDGDVHATLMHLLRDAGVLDPETDAPLFATCTPQEETRKLLDEAKDFSERMTSQPWACELVERLADALTRRSVTSQASEGEAATLSIAGGEVYGLTTEQARRAIAAALTPPDIPFAIDAAIKGMRVLKTMLTKAKLAGADVADEIIAGLMELGRDPDASPSKRVERLETAAVALDKTEIETARDEFVHSTTKEQIERWAYKWADDLLSTADALSSLPAQAVGEAETEAAARAINPVAFQVDPPHAKDSDAKRMMRAIARNQAQDALTAAALVHRDQVKL